ncbi:hypothetical protein M378DRAFT_164578 [Amanita muscaria Koide BX008]|uniref:Uncharacterized protein n=1 Tax=Amanita muscaria (strain Koide BX008) TaxID=946122 RepID=A0A0C2SJ93_AMAMK|nr:hypothetical protein M378DRAFT_164578 [Amanita muscaria Koide BX008]
MKNLLSVFETSSNRRHHVDLEMALLIIVKNSWWIDVDFWKKIDVSLEQFKAQDYVQKLNYRVSSVPLKGREGLIDMLRYRRVSRHVRLYRPFFLHQ